MSEDPTKLYRFALLLTGEPTSAEATIVNALQRCAGRAHQIRDMRVRRRMLVQEIVLRAVAKNRSVPPNCRSFEELPGSYTAISSVEDPVRLVEAVSALPDPLRVAAAAFYSNVFSAEELPTVLNMDPEQTGLALQAARLAILSKMDEATSTTPQP